MSDAAGRRAEGFDPLRVLYAKLEDSLLLFLLAQVRNIADGATLPMTAPLSSSVGSVSRTISRQAPSDRMIRVLE